MANPATRAADAASAGRAARTGAAALPRRFFGRRWRRLALWVAAILGAVGAEARMEAVTLDELLNEPKITPKRFANHFENFDFEPHDEVQPPDEFLATQKGDCDDYAILADYVLSRKNYHTRLIHVRLVGRLAHAVCYVIEQKVYLDYNNRVFFANLEHCGPSLREIATKAADSFNANWTSASVFTYDYQNDRKRMLVTVVKTEPPSADPDLIALPLPSPVPSGPKR